MTQAKRYKRYSSEFKREAIRTGEEGVTVKAVCDELGISTRQFRQPFRRREGAMSKFQDVKTLQKFASVHASIHNHFNQDRHFKCRETFKQNRSAALAEWCQIAA